MYEVNLKFKKFLYDNGIKHKALAKKLGLNPTLFSKKLNEKKGSKFDIVDLRKIGEVLNISIQEYFFENLVDTKDNKII
ncbi:helix-turn-helix domain-containing protein [Streptobacillus moniliformis]|uniref:helix-turn-helix domain-containing protein n=1 Tax=Streptobacillus moniliformis TaxID=34105 RepID=UPI0007E3766F|nr:helix-turn-helix domain-containing protein [Streptobacillus moniliformis]